MTRPSLCFATVLATAAALAVTLTACRSPMNQLVSEQTALPDLLVVQVSDGLAVLRTREVQRLEASILAPDGHTLIAAQPEGGQTVLRWVSTRTRATVATTSLAGAWVARVAAPDGSRVALTQPAAGTDPLRPPGRERSSLLVVDRGGAHQMLDLAGNYEPDAFAGREWAGNGNGLFVLEWLPAAAPNRYRVRVVDLRTGAPGPLFDRLKRPLPPGAEEQMRGQGRLSAYGPGFTTVYTLYTHQPDHQHSRDLISGRPGNAHAFVHTLSRTEGWAYCVDLPQPFGAGPGEAHTLVVPRSGGTRVYVADVASGSVAAIDTSTLTVDRVATVAALAGTAHATSTAASLYLAAGSTIQVIDRDRLAMVATWRVAGEISGVLASPDGRRIYVGQPDRIDWLDAATGAVLGSFAVPGLTGLRIAL